MSCMWCTQCHLKERMWCEYFDDINDKEVTNKKINNKGNHALDNELENNIGHYVYVNKKLTNEDNTYWDDYFDICYPQEKRGIEQELKRNK